MKKFFLSSGLVITFIIYSVHKSLAGSGNSTAGTDLSLNNPPKVTQPESSPTQTVGNSVTPTLFIPTVTPQLKANGLKDGKYTGDSADAYYGNVQVKITVSSGKITDVQFLDYPQDRRTSVFINSQAIPYLKTEAIQAQSANVDVISGATQTSLAFIQSLQSALAQAKG